MRRLNNSWKASLILWRVLLETGNKKYNSNSDNDNVEVYRDHDGDDNNLGNIGNENNTDISDKTLKATGMVVW